MNLKRAIKNLLSIEVMIVLLTFIALSCAVATFIENDFGPIGSKSFIYNQKWFEILFGICSLGIIYHIIYSEIRKKLFSLTIHISLIIILLGAFLTRYYGFEATMTIPETTMNNIAYSTDEYINVKIDDKKHYSKKVLLSPLKNTDFDTSINIDDETIHIKLDRFIKNSTTKLIEAKEGKPTVDIFLANFNGSENILLKESENKELEHISFSFTKNVIEKNKPTIFFKLIDDKFYMSSNVKIHMSNMDKEITSIEKNKSFEIDTNLLYKVAQTQFKIKDTALKGKLKTVAIPVKKEKNINALVFKIKHKGKTEKKTIFKTEGNNFAQTSNFTIANKDIELSWGSKLIKLPFFIHLNDFELKRYPGSNAPSEYSSYVKVFDKKDKYTKSHTISMNQVLDYKGYRFFQTSYKEDESATILSINKDPGKEVTYIGYFLLFTGLILALFSKNGRFRKLASTKYNMKNIKDIYEQNRSIVTILLISLMFSIPSYANENKGFNINKSFSKEFSKLLIQDYQGRIKPLDTLSKQILTKLNKGTTIKNLDSNQFFISASLYPEYWKKQEIFKIKSPRLQMVLSTQKNYINFNDLFDRFGNYSLEKSLNISHAKEAKDRDKFDKELIKLDEKINIMFSLFRGDFLRAFPLKNHPNNKWINFDEADTLYNNKEIVELSKNFYLSLFKSISTNDWENAFKKLEQIKEYQNTNINLKLPSSFKIKSELLFNKMEIFKKLFVIYILIGTILLLLTIINIVTTKINLQKATKVSLVLLLIAFLLHTFGLGLRWYISGHAPWSNAYESMLYIAWTIILSGMFFSKQSHLALASTAILSGITLFVAHLNWLEPEITTLVPVLKSYWLSIHVSVITASYGFLALSALLGFITLILFIFLNEKNKDERFYRLLIGIKESNRISMMAIFIGVVLLVIGNFLGAIWANESWGRYWGWDPKETWTLISIIIYVIIIHLNYVKNFMSEYIFALLATFSYSSIIMTYFGVNYFLSGKHSYAAGDPIPIPTFVPITFIILLIICVLSFRNRKVI